MRKREMRSRLRHHGDPLVPVIAERLRGALELRRLTLTEMEDKADTSHQRITQLLGKPPVKVTRRRDHEWEATVRPQRCRRSLRARIAKALKVSPAWLGGEPSNPLLNYLRAPFRELLTPAQQLAVSDLLAKAEAALLRDCKGMDAKDAENTFTWLVWTLQELLDPTVWQDRLVVGDRTTNDGAVIALASALEHILTPWFEGGALDYGNLARMAGLGGFSRAGEFRRTYRPARKSKPTEIIPKEGK